MVMYIVIEGGTSMMYRGQHVSFFSLFNESSHHRIVITSRNQSDQNSIIVAMLIYCIYICIHPIIPFYHHCPFKPPLSDSEEANLMVTIEIYNNLNSL